MRRKLSRISMVLGVERVACDRPGVGRLRRHDGKHGEDGKHRKHGRCRAPPAWHTILSVPNGTKANQVDTVVATGNTSGWAFLNDGQHGYERTSATAWKKVAFPGSDGAVNVAASVLAVQRVGRLPDPQRPGDELLPLERQDVDAGEVLPARRLAHRESPCSAPPTCGRSAKARLDGHGRGVPLQRPHVDGGLGDPARRVRA